MIHDSGESRHYQPSDPASRPAGVPPGASSHARPTRRDAGSHNTTLNDTAAEALPSLPDASERAFSYYEALRKLSAHLEAGGIHRLSLTEAAAIACLERKYFSAFFKERVGTSFSDWMRHKLVRRAMRLISSSDTPIREIASRIGFVDLRTFERAFRRVTGMSPRAYRRLRTRF